VKFDDVAADVIENGFSARSGVKEVEVFQLNLFGIGILHLFFN